MRIPDGAIAALFPELAGAPVRFGHGLLRAPPRARRAPPCLSVVPADAADRVLAERGWESGPLLAEAAVARRTLAEARIGGEWWRGSGDELPNGDGYAIVEAGPALPAMLDAARAAHPADRIAIIRRPVDPWLLLDRAARLYCAGGESGFLALIAGVPVSAFAAAFYTGWGATEDAPGVPQRAFGRSVDEIVAGAILIATRYLDPFRGVRTDFAEAAAILADWRRLDAANRRIAVCVGMSFWKRRRIADFVRSSAGVPRFRRTAAGALAGARRHSLPGAIAGWASRLPAGLAERAMARGVELIRVEDGFIRSVGLGSDFLPPASLVLDRRGMYFDPRTESDLEVLLRESEFAPPLLARAERLAALLVQRGITKYNLAGGAALAVPPGRRRILVPGQVEDDLSIQLGGGAIRTNLALLAETRRADPDGFIVYKPHPDVLAGHRVGAVPEIEARRFADRIVTGGSTAALLAEIDEVQTMTSLLGFEALLRERRVVVHGRPFYSGWGLTEDRPAFDRGRRLSLAELVAGALILYPRYLDPLTRLPCGPEIVIERLDHPELWRPGALVQARRLQGAMARRLAEWRAQLSLAWRA